jgi:hypothetical protein
VQPAEEGRNKTHDANPREVDKDILEVDAVVDEMLTQAAADLGGSTFNALAPVAGE